MMRRITLENKYFRNRKSEIIANYCRYFMSKFISNANAAV